MRRANTKQLLDYWLTLFNSKDSNSATGEVPRWPLRSAINPAECRNLLSTMFVLEFDGEEVNYRLAGTDLCQMFGKDLKSTPFAGHFGAKDKAAVDDWAHQLGIEGHVTLLCSTAETATGERVNLETILLPLLQDGTFERRVLGITTPDERVDHYGHAPFVIQTVRSVRFSKPWEAEFDSRHKTEIDSELMGLAQLSPDEGEADVFEQLFPRISVQNPPMEMPEPLEPQTDIPQKRVFGHLRVIEGGRE